MRVIDLVLLCFTVSTASASDYVHSASAAHGTEARMATDDFSFLEDANNPRAQAWLKAQNERTATALRGSQFRSSIERALQVAEASSTFEALAIPGAIAL